METIQLREELFREMSPMLDSEEMLRKMIAYVRSLFKQEQARTTTSTTRNYRQEIVAPDIEQWFGCAQVSDAEFLNQL